MRNFNGWIKACQIAELTPQTIVQRSNPNKKSTPKHNHPLRVLDLACGKGGDLGKWIRHDRGIQTYVGIDVARGSLKDAAIRARSMRDSFKNGACTFICADLGADRLRPVQSVTSAVTTLLEGEDDEKVTTLESTPQLLCWSLAKESREEKGEPHFSSEDYGGISLDESFDVVSIQFAIHYMMSTRQRAMRFFRTVSDLLDVGGNLIITTIDARVVLEYIMASGYNFHKMAEDTDETFVINIANGTCRLKFHKEIIQRIFTSCDLNTFNPLDDHNFGLEYVFTLVEGDDHAAGVGEAVDLPEWLSPLPVLEALATEVGMKLDYAVNFHEFYSSRKNPINHAKAHSALYSMKVLNRNGTISDEEWEISRLYIAVKFTKVSSTKS
jgi:mRNA (guanine-N7-)-methyltransferase